VRGRRTPSARASEAKVRTFVVASIATMFTASAASATPGELALNSATTSTVFQGYQDPLNAFIYNTAPSGSDPVSYSIFATFPYGDSSIGYGTKDADGGTSYITVPFLFDTSQVDAGTYTVSVTATDTGNGGSLTQSGDVTVLDHADPGFVFGGRVVNLSSTPPAMPDAVVQEPSVDPLAFGATGGGESFSAAAPNLIGDPIAPTGAMDLDSITVFGDPQITITLAPFDDLAANDDPAYGKSFQVIVDGSVPGTYFTIFELNYSDDDEVPGAYADGSEHGYFAIRADVTESGVTGELVVPEPSSCALLALGVALLAFRRDIARG
jgi:hypothetical protein